MINQFKFKSIRSRQAFWLFIVAVLPLGLFSYIFINQHVETLKQESFIKLSAIRDIKVQELNHWLNERTNDLGTFAESIRAHYKNTEKLNPEARTHVLELLKGLEKNHASFYEVFIVNAKTANVTLSTNLSHIGHNKINDPYFFNPLKSGKVYIKDIYNSQTLGRPSMSFSMPIFSGDSTSKIAAVLVLRINLEASLYKILSERTGLGDTGEMLIVNSDVITVNQVRYHPDSALNLLVDASPARNGANGKTGIIESLDYRYVPVLAAYTYIPRTKWGVIVKQDQSEIYAPINNLYIEIAVIFLVVAVLVFIVTYYLSHKLTQPLLSIATVARRIQSGEGNLRNEIVSLDELGFLAKSFNEMADSLEGEKQLLKNYLENIISSMPSILIGVDENSNVVMWNHEAQSQTRLTSEEATGKPVTKVLPLLSEYTDKIERAVHFNSPDIVRQVKYELGGERKTLDIVIYPLHGKDLFGAVIRIDDVSDAANKDEMLRHTQKMDALGKLTGGVAHDFNNMLAVILGFAELLDGKLNHESKEKKYTKEIMNAAMRAKNLTAKLLSFSRKDSISTEDSIDLNMLLAEEHNMLSKTLTAQIDLQFDFDKNLWPIWVDKGRMEDAILNMCINSMHAMPNGGTINISTKNISVQNVMSDELKLGAGDYVCMTIKDTGMGMSKDIQEQIFDPFFTTKGTDGTGLGLSQVYGFIQQSKGSIKVDSLAGKGTQIDVYLPRYYDKQGIKSSNLQDSESNYSLGNGERILIVDDEQALLDVAGEILRPAGYDVVKANSGEEALDILKQETVTFDLLLTDVVMPKMGGYQLISKVKKLYPNIKLQVASGYTDNRTEEDFDSSLHENRLSKPYSRGELLKKVRQTLDEYVVEKKANM